MINMNSWLNRLRNLNTTREEMQTGEAVHGTNRHGGTCAEEREFAILRGRATSALENQRTSIRSASDNRRATLRRRATSALGNQGGMTLAEVMVAFMVLMIVFAIFYRGVNLASNLNRSALANESRIEAAIEQFYLDSDATADEASEAEVVASYNGTPAFKLNDSVCKYPAGGFVFYYWKAGGNQ